jgi:predicted transcriptional regulator
MTREQDEEYWQDTLNALESVKEGKVIDGEKVHDWLESWGTAQEKKRFDGMRNLDD